MPAKEQPNPPGAFPCTDEDEIQAEEEEGVDPNWILGDELEPPNELPINVIDDEPEEAM